MKRAVAVLTLVTLLFGAGLASASWLVVEGGGLMVLTAGFVAPTPPPGQAGTSIEATKSAEGFWVSLAPDVPVAGVRGEICVTNTGDVATEGLRIVDVVQTKAGPGPFGDYVSADVDVSAWPVLAPLESRCYSYAIHFAPLEGAQYRNVARVTITNHSGWLPGGENCPGPEACPFGPEPKAGFTLPDLQPPRGTEEPTATPEATATETPTPTAAESPP